MWIKGWEMVLIVLEVDDLWNNGWKAATTYGVLVGVLVVL
jgi:hypothetical protein